VNTALANGHLSPNLELLQGPHLLRRHHPLETVGHGPLLHLLLSIIPLLSLTPMGHWSGQC
jgi:hypothetical protein